MKLTRWNLVRKYLLKSKIEVYILYKRVWSDQETGSRNEGGGATSSEATQEYFGAKWRLADCYKERLTDPKISWVIVLYFKWHLFLDIFKRENESDFCVLQFWGKEKKISGS